MSVKTIKKWKRLLESGKKEEVISEMEIIISERQKRIRENKQKAKTIKSTEGVSC